MGYLYHIFQGLSIIFSMIFTMSGSMPSRRQIFRASQIGNIAGSYVLDGIFQRGCKIRITRQGEQIYEGALASLKRFKDDVKEVREGFECGLVFEGFDQIQELDVVEAYIMVEVPR